MIFKALDSMGATLPVRERTSGQPLYLAAIEELLRIAGDPDHSFFSRLGVGISNPRVPAISIAAEQRKLHLLASGTSKTATAARVAKSSSDAISLLDSAEVYSQGAFM